MEAAGAGSKSTQKFVCDSCGRSYAYKKGLTAHVKKAHPSDNQAPGTSTQAKPTKILKCPVCEKTYKSEKGLLDHLKLHSKEQRATTTSGAVAETLTSQRTEAVISDATAGTSPKQGTQTTGDGEAGDFFDEIIREDEAEAGEIELSGASIEVAHSRKKSSKQKQNNPAQQDNPPKLTIKCDICGESFGSQNKIEKHYIEHKLAEFYSRQIVPGDLCDSIEVFVTQILSQILLEGSDFQKIMAKVLSEVSSDNWKHFIGSVSEHLIPCVTSPKAVIPSVKYEEQLIVFNKLLNNENKFSLLLNQFKNLVPLEYVTSPILGMILFRLLSKLFEEVATKVLNSMMRHSVLSEEINVNIDEEGFERQVSKFIQAYYAKGVSSGSMRWITRCACVRKSFIEILDNENISVEAICKNSSWENHLVKLNPNVVKFFMSIEVLIVSLLHSKVPVTPSGIFDDLFKEENVFKLDLWYSLTATSFPVLESIAFMKELIRSFVKLSLKLEVTRLRDIEVQGRPGKYALRTDLKRN